MLYCRGYEGIPLNIGLGKVQLEIQSNQKDEISNDWGYDWFKKPK